MFLTTANRSTPLALKNAEAYITERVQRAGGFAFCQCHDENDMLDQELNELDICVRCLLPPSE